MYAIIRDGGHQYRVEPGQRIRLQLHDVEDGATITLDQVCLIGGEGEPTIGTPVIDGAKVEAKVTRALVKGDKIHIRTFKRRKDLRRHVGHRQKFTEVEITKIVS